MISSIKRRLILSLLMASILPLFVFSSVLLYKEYRVQKQQTLLLQQEKAIRTSQQIENYFFNLQKDIKFLFSITPFLFTDIEKQRNYFSKLILKQNQFDRLSLTNEKGEEIFYSDRLSPYIKSKTIKYPNLTLTNSALKNKKISYGEIYFHEKNFEPLIDVVFPIQELKSQKIKGFLVAKIRFKNVWDILSSITLQETEEIFVIDSKGLIIAHKNPSMVIKKEKISNFKQNGFTQNLNQEYILQSINNFKLGNRMFSVIVQQNIKEALSLSLNTFILAIVLMISLLVFIIIVIRYINSSIIKPITELSDVAISISKGDFEQKALVYGTDELSVLAKTFNKMTSKIDKILHNLKHEIQLKTKIQNNLELSEKRLQEILDNAEAIIYLKDINGNYLIVNKEFSKLLKTQKEDIVNKHCSNFFSGENLDRILNMDKRIIETKKNISSEDSLVTEDGEKIFLSNRFPIFDKTGKVINIAGVSTNITHIKNIQKQLEDFNKNLEKKVEDKTNSLKISNQELEKTIQELKKTQEQLIFSEKMASLGSLVAGVSHEINTPLGIALTGISYFDDINKNLKKLYESDTLSQNEFEEYLSTSSSISSQVLSNITRAANLIKAFKEVSTDQTTEEKREFNLKEYTDDLILSLDNQLKKTKVKIKNNIPSRISINSFPGFYGQIITNLILNSLIHAYEKDDEGLISISLREEQELLIFNYKDNGKGIKEKDLPHIFEPFFTTNRGLGGTGLGLNIIYNIIRKHFNGKITCISKPNQGVNFEITFPKD